MNANDEIYEQIRLITMIIITNMQVHVTIEHMTIIKYLSGNKNIISY